MQTQSFDADVVVSLENTDLQLGHYYDADSISGALLDDCVREVFDQFAEIAPKAELSSILFPRPGAATTSMEPMKVARKPLNPIVHKMTTIRQCRRTVTLARLESHRHAVYHAAAELGLKELS